MGKLFGFLNREPKKGAEGASPRKGFGRFFFLLWTHFGKLIALNFLFIVFSLPLLTLPAAFCAMMRVLFVLSRDGNVFLWDEFWGEFKAELFRSIPMGLLFLLMLAGAACSGLIAYVNWGSVYGVLFGAIALALLLFELLLSSYGFLMLAMTKLTPSQALNNAWRLVIAGKWRSPAALLLMLLLWAAWALSLPYSFPVLLVCWIALAELAVCLTLAPVISRYAVAEPPSDKDE